MDSLTILGIIVVILVAVVAFQTIQLIGISNRITGAAAASGGSIDMTGWTENEKMNYEMHGILPSRLQQSQQQTPRQGVGGC